MGIYEEISQKVVEKIKNIFKIDEKIQKIKSSR